MSRLPPRGVFLPVHATGTVPVRAHRGLWPHRRPLRICRARLLFADRFRAGAGRRSGSGWRQGRVRWGRPLLSRPPGRGELSALGLPLFMRLLSRLRFRPSRGRAGVKGRVCRWVWMVVRFVCVIRVPVCARVSRVCPVCVPAPPVSFTFYRLLSRPRFRPSRGRAGVKGRVCRWVWIRNLNRGQDTRANGESDPTHNKLKHTTTRKTATHDVGFGCVVVRFVCVIRVSARVRLCVPCVSRLPPVSFYRSRLAAPPVSFYRFFLPG